MTRGIEYEVNLQPVEWLKLSGNYTFITAQETTQSRVNFKDTVYNYSLRRPTHMFNITAGFQISRNLYASINGRYVGDRYDVGAYKKPDVAMDSYFIVGAYAEYSFLKVFKAFFDWQNIGNKRFFEIRGYNGIPSLFNTGVTFNW
jgi:vitamin B12 transporter